MVLGLRQGRLEKRGGGKAERSIGCSENKTNNGDRWRKHNHPTPTNPNRGASGTARLAF